MSQVPKSLRLAIAALAGLFLAGRAEASLTRTTSPALEASALTLTAPAPEPSEFSLFEGTEITAAATEPERAPSFHPLAAVSLLSKDGAERPLVSADELSYPKTRYRVFELLGAPILGELRGVSLELHWRSGEFRAGLASGTVGWLSQDPIGDRDSVNLYGYVGMRPHELTDPLGLQTAQPTSPYCRPGAISDPDMAAFMCGVTRREGGLSSSLPAPGAPHVDQASLAKAWAAWKQLPEKAREAGKEFWRYEPKVTPEQREYGADWGAEAAKRGGQVMGDIYGAGAAGLVEAGQVIVETEVGGRLVRAVVGAGGKVIRIVEDLGPARAIAQTREFRAFEIVPYGTEGTRAAGFEKHHGVLDVWASKNVPGYIRRGAGTPSILLTPEQHAATQRVYEAWLEARTGRKVGASVDWTQVTPREAQELSERMFEAARVPEEARRAYYSEFHKYIYRQ
jgi:hypothetical protein